MFAFLFSPLSPCFLNLTLCVPSLLFVLCLNDIYHNLLNVFFKPFNLSLVFMVPLMFLFFLIHIKANVYLKIQNVCIPPNILYSTGGTRCTLGEASVLSPSLNMYYTHRIGHIPSTEGRAENKQKSWSGGREETYHKLAIHLVQSSQY